MRKNSGLGFRIGFVLETQVEVLRPGARAPELRMTKLSGRCLREGGAEALEGRGKVFGEDAGFAGDGHEAGVADPAGQTVEMDVTGDAGAGGAAEIHAEIHAVWFVERLESGFGALRE